MHRLRPRPPPSRPSSLLGGSSYVRLWQSFMSARVILAVAIVLLQLLAIAMGQSAASLLVGIGSSYLLATVLMWLWLQPAPSPLGAQWLPTIGLDLLVFSALQVLQSDGVNYAPLLGLPLLMAAVLGSLLMALATAASITLLLLANAWWLAQVLPGDAAPQFSQAALASIGYFIVAFLMHQLATRLVREEQQAMRSQLTAAVLAQVNGLVIETLDDGVLVVDQQGLVHAANPAARGLLGVPHSALAEGSFRLSDDPAWAAVCNQARSTFVQGRSRRANITLEQAGHSPRKLHASTRLAGSGAATAQSLCVVFLRDLREIEVRLRTEKLAAMGRMSAAVAHEIRNPLAAILQANALLYEDLADPGQQQLSRLVRQNAQRLNRITEEVLGIARLQHQVDLSDGDTLVLDDSVASLFADWAQSSPAGAGAQLHLKAAATAVVFDVDHLHRVLVNLLDNALRYISAHADALQISTGIAASGHAGLQVWSDGPALEQGVEPHLFEPFFSSHSRSSGLGLYICRELCERHGATISYRRIARHTTRGKVSGNAFIVVFRPAPPASMAEVPFERPLV